MNSKIYALKNDLKLTDYQLLKTAEFLVRKYVAENGTDGLPYPDIIDRLDAREEQRQQINQLKEELKNEK